MSKQHYAMPNSERPAHREDAGIPPQTAESFANRPAIQKFDERLAACACCHSPNITAMGEKRRFDTTFHIDRCRNCGCAFMNPRPTFQWLEDIYSRSGHGLTSPISTKAVEDREQRFPATTLDAKRIVAAALAATAPDGRRPLAALDIGSGYGFFTRELQRQGCSVTAVNPGQWENSVFRDLNGFDPIPSFFEDIDFGATKFDLIVLSQVLEHVADPFSFLNRVNGVMPVGGVLACAVPNRRSFLVALRGLKEQSCFWVPEHLNYFCTDSLERLLKKTGFRIVESSTVTRIPPHRMIERMGLTGGTATAFTAMWRYAQLPFAPAVDAVGRGLYINVTAVKQEPIC